MKPVSLILFAALFAGAGAAHAADRASCLDDGNCAIAPRPPAPPMPPAPPAPPPERPELAELPQPPEPPAPPPRPVVPAQAHAACAGKAEGTRITYRVRKGETMRGTCQLNSQGTYFDLEEYRSVN